MFHSSPSRLILLILLPAAVSALTQSLLGDSAGIPAAANTRHPRLIDRATVADVNKAKAGLLFKNGTQTTCTLGIIDAKAALVSADCLDYIKDDVNNATSYEVYITSSFDETSSKHDVTKISVHPNYSKETKANNVAVVQFNENSDVAWVNYNAAARSKWAELVYVQYSLSNPAEMKWNAPRVYSLPNTDDADCADYSFVYRDNKKEFVCSSKVITDVPAGVSADCSKVPYGMVYATVGDYVYPAGMLSHVAIKNADSLCNSKGEVRAYYTLFSDYLAFAANVLGRVAYFYTADNNTRPQTDYRFAMDVPSGAARDIQVVGGDMYAKQMDAPEPTSAAASSSAKSSGSGDKSTDSSDASPTDSDSGNSDGSKEKGDSGTSKKTTVIAAVCSAVGAVLLATGLFFFVKWWRKHGVIRRQRDPYKETAAQEFLADSLGGASVPAARAQPDPSHEFLFARPPPTYADSAAALSPTSVMSPMIPEAPQPPATVHASSLVSAPGSPVPVAAANHGYPADEKS